eukprot:GILJ01005340.1.p1 GENE.GILJ01005340.1~~GILJ01005340.1.p1  ORF type:complete len:406 (-),score=53.22 GILJ01005340.1:806-2023(-)
MARVTGVSLNQLVRRGQQYKVFNQICRQAAKEEYIIPTMPKVERDDETNEKGYEGATVIDAQTGMYFEPITTLDFTSLYPSIIIAYNLSYETLLTKGIADIERFKFKTSDVNQFQLDASTTTCFLKPHVQGRKALLPSILEHLLSSRKKAKKEMESTDDPHMKKILNGKQLALKISCNSVYGFCGAVAGFLPCIPIAASVTAIGRSLIAQTKDIVESHFTLENGFEANATVVYGDTDSVMVNFHLGQRSESVERAMALGKMASSLVTASFPHPINLDFEKVYKPYMLFSKKRYAGLLYSSSPDRYDKMDVKGLENVRRDSCAIVRETVQNVLDLILKNQDVNRAKELVNQVVNDLHNRRVDLFKLRMSKNLSKMDYKSKMPHVELAKRMMKRDPSSAPKVCKLPH